jgi:hypothetical protein
LSLTDHASPQRHLEGAAAVGVPNDLEAVAAVGLRPKVAVVEVEWRNLKKEEVVAFE